jgi:hypothetical protein
MRDLWPRPRLPAVALLIMVTCAVSSFSRLGCPYWAVTRGVAPVKAYAVYTSAQLQVRSAQCSYRLPTLPADQPNVVVLTLLKSFLSIPCLVHLVWASYHCMKHWPGRLPVMTQHSGPVS